MCRANLQPFALLCPPALPTQEVHWGVAKTFASWVRFLLCPLNYYRLLLKHDRLNHDLLNHWQKGPLPLNTAARAALIIRIRIVLFRNVLRTISSDDDSDDGDDDDNDDDDGDDDGGDDDDSDDAADDDDDDESVAILGS